MFQPQKTSKGHNYPPKVIHRPTLVYCGVVQNNKVGDMIMVEGNIQSNYRPGRGSRTSIIVDRILPLWHSPRRYENEFEVYGTVKSIVKLGNSHKVNLNVVCNGFTSTIPVTFNYNDYRLNAETGEPIRVSGLVCTSSRTVGDRTLYYQNYVANGIL